MTEQARRGYRSGVRAEQARRTRRRILDAAQESFAHNGYAATTIRSVAAAAGVSVPTVELTFGTKPALLKAAIDVAIAGDDEPVAVLDRDWAATARAAEDVEAFLAVGTAVLAAAQERSAGLVLAAFEGAASDPELAELADRLSAQRAVTASWLVDALIERGPLRAELDHGAAVDCVWLLMDPAVFVRATRHRGWTTEAYQAWVARSIRRLLLPDQPRSRRRPPRKDPP